MKVNNNIIGCTSPNTMKPNATNGRSYLEAWANYISMWIDSYEAAGIPIWGVTPQVRGGVGGCAYDTKRLGRLHHRRLCIGTGGMRLQVGPP